MLKVIIGIVYMLVGVLLATPYCFLAGWSARNFPIIVFVAPAFVAMWFNIAGLAGIFRKDYEQGITFHWRNALGIGEHRGSTRAIIFFWIWTAYSLLPIILHWSALLLEKFGYLPISSLLDTHRYASPLYVWTGAVVLIIFMVIAKKMVAVTKSASNS